MSQFSFNCSKGREVEFFNRVLYSDPPYSAFTLVVLSNSGLEADSVLRQYDTLAAILAASNDEATNVNYARIELDYYDLSAYTVDDDLSQILLELPTQTYADIAVGDLWRKLVICYDEDTTGGTDADLIPVTAQDILDQNTGQAVIPNGNDIIFAWPAGWLYAS